MSPTPQGMIAVAVILPVFATLAVVARISVRRMKGTRLFSDDWTILVALVRPMNGASLVENLHGSITTRQLDAHVDNGNHTDCW